MFALKIRLGWCKVQKPASNYNNKAHLQQKGNANEKLNFKICIYLNMWKKNKHFLKLYYKLYVITGIVWRITIWLYS